MKFKRYLKIFASLMIFSLITSSVFGYIEPDFKLNAQATAIYSLDSDTMVYEDNADAFMAPASLTKIMTALVILNNSVNLTDTIEITSDMLKGLAEANASVMGLRVGEVISIKDLLYGLLLPSGADAARALAIYNSGQIDAFVNEMNRTADKLGATNTQFENPSGLDHESQHTTASDMVKIMKAALQHDIFKEVISTDSYTTDPTNKHPKGISFKSSNKLKDSSNKYFTPYVIGGKTGFTGNAGRCFASYGMSKNGESYIVISLRAPFEGYAANSRAFEDAKNIYKWLDSNFSLVTIKGDGELASTFPVSHSFNRSFQAVYDGDVQIITDGVMDLNSLEFIPWGLESYSAPIHKDQFVGYMRIYDGDKLVGYQAIKAAKTIKYSKVIVFLENLQSFLQQHWLKLLIGMACLFIAYVFIRSKQRAKLAKKRREEFVKNRLNELSSQKKIKG